jgi:hypothetical protein
MPDIHVHRQGAPRESLYRSLSHRVTRCSAQWLSISILAGSGSASVHLLQSTNMLRLYEDSASGRCKITSAPESAVLKRPPHIAKLDMQSWSFSSMTMMTFHFCVILVVAAVKVNAAPAEHAEVHRSRECRLLFHQQRTLLQFRVNDPIAVLY